ncbi:MAG: LysM peptidoglycan-binding domain-containing protein, partial [Spirochaetales bacterium]|nr:LysM peptidoglycan-binding domain-containing protein [Spirochaetales bacterium]
MKHFWTLILTFCCATVMNAETYKYHTIKDGETLWRISKNYNVTMDKLCEINKIKDATKVKQGTTLKIPVEAKTAAAKTETK